MSENSGNRILKGKVMKRLLEQLLELEQYSVYVYIFMMPENNVHKNHTTNYKRQTANKSKSNSNVL